MIDLEQSPLLRAVDKTACFSQKARSGMDIDS